MHIRIVVEIFDILIDRGICYEIFGFALFTAGGYEEG